MYLSQKRKPIIFNYVPWHNKVDTTKFVDAFNRLKNYENKKKWKGIKDSLILKHDPNSEMTSIELQIIDEHNNIHQLIIKLCPETPFDENDENYLYLWYNFSCKHDKDKIAVRSFPEYIMDDLVVNGFEPSLTEDKNGLWMPCHIDCLYEAFCKLIELVLSKTKPLDWFYSKEPHLSSYDDMHYYLLKVSNELKSRANLNKWEGIKSTCFKVMDDTNETSIFLEYQVDDVWTWLITLNGLWCDKYPDLSIDISCYPCHKLPTEIEKKLDTLFADFLDRLPSSNDNIWVGGGRGEHSLGIQYFHIEDSLDLFSNLLDEVTSHLKSFNFHISSPSIILTEEMETMKMHLEETLGTSFNIATTEDEINSKFKNGYFKE